MNVPAKIAVGYVALVCAAGVLFVSGYTAGHAEGHKEALRPLAGKILAEVPTLRKAMIAAAGEGGAIWFGPGDFGVLESDVWVGGVKMMQLSKDTVVNPQVKEAR